MIGLWQSWKRAGVTLDKMLQDLEEKSALVKRVSDQLRDERLRWQAREKGLEAGILELEQKEAELTSECETLQARVEHQRAELQAVHRALEEAQRLTDRTLDSLAEERKISRELMRGLLDSFVTLRRDGFNPDPRGQRIREYDDMPSEPAEDKPPTPAEEHAWLRIVEVIQDRAGGDATLQSKMVAQAERWRKLKIPYEEIENRIWTGYDADD